MAPTVRTGVTGLLAQVAPDPDLTRPIVVITVCAVIIIVTIVVQVVRARRRAHALTPEALQEWQTSSGRLLDQWIDGVEGEVRARRSAPVPAGVLPTPDPPGFAEATADCPDPVLVGLIAELRARAGTLLGVVRSGDPNRPEVATAEAAWLAAKEQAGAHLRDAFVVAAPQ